jgi:hypothetical protein
MGWILSHKGKATASETTYNPDDPPEAYSNPSIHSRINAYMETGRQIHGPEWDPIRAPFDGEAVMRMGHGKKHGHYYMGDSILDTATTPTLAMLKAKDTGNAPPILPRPAAALAHVERLQVISVILILNESLHMFPDNCNTWITNCRRP